jgi:recombinational DNA repair protein RecR
MTPGSRHGLLHSLDQIRKLYKEVNPVKSEIKNCKKCGEITSREICQACTMKRWLEEN